MANINKKKTVSIRKLAERYNGEKHGDVVKYIGNAYYKEFRSELNNVIANRESKALKKHLKKKA